MRVAVIGSRGLNRELPENCMPKNATMIVSGGARGIDTQARVFAGKHNITILEIIPDYDIYGKTAPLKRNDIIINYSDMVIAFWDGQSHGTGYVINKCRKLGKPLKIYKFENNRYTLMN